MSGPWSVPNVTAGGMNCSLQQYLLLHSQQASMRRFSESTAFPTPASTPSEEGDRPILERRTSDPGNRPQIVSDHQIPSDPEGDLYHVTLDIKNTLTRLLNQEPVQTNNSFRRWTQERLMDSERDLKEQRRSRRRGSDSSVDSSRPNSLTGSIDTSPRTSLSGVSDVNVRPPVV